MNAPETAYAGVGFGSAELRMWGSIRKTWACLAAKLPSFTDVKTPPFRTSIRRNMTDFPKTGFDGEWRWKDAYFFNTSREIKLQKKGWLFWRTVASSLYWPKGYDYQPDRMRCIHKVLEEARTTLAIDRGTEIHPA